MIPSEILIKATLEARKAFQDATPEPMTVTDGTNTWTIDEGMCGFASINISPARGSFVQYLKKLNIGYSDSYLKGYTVSANTKSQSYERNKAWATAFADVLNSEGINATVHSRID